MIKRERLLMARRRKSAKKWISRLFFLVLLIVAIAVCYLVWEAYFKDEGPAPEKEKETVVELVEEKKEESPKEEELVKKEEVAQYDGGNPNENESLTGVITYLGVSDSDLMVRVNIDQYLTRGSCEINVVRGGEVLYTDLVPIIDSASTSTCEGFNVPMNNFGAGKIQVNINISSDKKTGMISGEIDI